MYTLYNNNNTEINLFSNLGIYLPIIDKNSGLIIIFFNFDSNYDKAYTIIMSDFRPLDSECIVSTRVLRPDPNSLSI